MSSLRLAELYRALRHGKKTFKCAECGKAVTIKFADLYDDFDAIVAAIDAYDDTAEHFCSQECADKNERQRQQGIIQAVLSEAFRRTLPADDKSVEGEM